MHAASRDPRRSSENQIEHAEHHQQADEEDDADDPGEHFQHGRSPVWPFRSIKLSFGPSLP
jgi:hypothetical protein